MTTVAYKDNIIAYDSQQTRGSTIITLNAQKLVVVNNLQIIFLGNIADQEPLINSYFNEHCSKKPEEICDNTLIVIEENSRVFRFCITKTGERVKSRIMYDEAWGSGEDIAMGAMADGASAIGAIEISILKNIYTGGKVRHVRLSV